jgi:hypothetical protein
MADKEREESLYIISGVTDGTAVDMHSEPCHVAATADQVSGTASSR